MLGYTKEWLKERLTLSQNLEIELSIRSIRRWWQVKTGKMDTPIDGEIPFWFVKNISSPKASAIDIHFNE